MQFPDNYPNDLLLIEMKSSVLPPKLLAKLTATCDKEIQQYKGKQQASYCIIYNFVPF